jgi:hypothetical protein
MLAVVVDRFARKQGLVRLSSPAALEPHVVKPKRFFTRIREASQPATKQDLPRIDSTIRVGDETFDGSESVQVVDSFDGGHTGSPRGQTRPRRAVPAEELDDDLLDLDVGSPVRFEAPAQVDASVRAVEDLLDVDHLVDEEELAMAKKPQARFMDRSAWKARGKRLGGSPLAR